MNTNKQFTDEELQKFVERYEQLREKRRVWGKNWREKPENKEKMREMGKRYRQKQSAMLQLCKDRGLTK